MARCDRFPLGRVESWRGLLCGLLMSGSVVLPLWNCHDQSFPVAIPARLEEFAPLVRDYLKHSIEEAQARPNQADAQASLGLAYAANKVWAEARTSFERASWSPTWMLLTRSITWPRRVLSSAGRA